MSRIKRYSVNFGALIIIINTRGRRGQKATSTNLLRNIILPNTNIMGIGSAKRAAAKAERTPAKTRSSASRQIKSENSPTTTDPRSSGRTRGGGRERSFSSNLPTDAQKRSNGRLAGRSLIVWGRPRMAEKLLLHLQFECSRHKVQVPWDAIAHRLHPGSSGAAVQQHLNRLRKELALEGHMVPPLCSRSSSGDNTDPEIRGYIRDETQLGNREALRPVTYSEVLEDRRFNLPGAYIEEHEVTEAEGLSDEEQDERVDDSPTPLSRSQRGKRSAHRSHCDSGRPESMSGSPYRLSRPGNGSPGHGDDAVEALLHSDDGMFTSPNHKRDQDHVDEQSAGAPHGCIEGAMFPGFPTMRAPHVAERHRGFNGFADPFLGHGLPVPQEGAAAGQQSHHDYYHNHPFGFTPWPMGFPNPYYLAHGMDYRGEKTDGSSQGHSFSTDPRTEASQAETMNSSLTKNRSSENIDFNHSQAAESMSFGNGAPAETHMDDLVDDGQVDIPGLIEPGNVLKLDSPASDDHD